MKDQNNNTGDWNTGDYNTGNRNTGNRNTGNRNTGDWNTGDYNTGNRNTGNCNTGNRNTGYRNTGNWNTGNRNTGYRNTGNRNTGDWNTGDWNTGNCNTGHWNTGNCNTGNCNTGHWNTGNCNTGNRNTGDLNTTTPTVRLFNHDSGWVFNDENHIRLKNVVAKYQRPLCEWISSSNMTDEEKKQHPTHETTQGYLKVNDGFYNGFEVNDEDRTFLESIPHFDAEILLQCTGIDLTNKKVKIVVDGKEIMILKEEFESIKKQFCS